MSRARAHALVLVNWKGVFYQRYLLDERVTALEGENGAGKTTVLIAGYVVLMPDILRLRFSNVGEQGTTGGDRGVWGRLGESGAPAYAAIDFGLPSGQRFIACVQLVRKAEPNFELKTFVIRDVRAETRLEELLLVRGERDRVPQTAELTENVARAGAVLQECASAKEYFNALFELGVSPLRLASDEERIKYNEMLRSSMAGGISRTLTSELRQFLLKEESGLSDTLTRMRNNLDACRNTRVEVAEAEKLEAEIHRVYESGEEMFAAAVLATRQRASELKKRRDEAAAGHREALEHEARQRALHDEARRAVDTAEDSVKAARVAEESARTRRDLVERAHRIDARIRGLEGELAEASARYDAAIAARAGCEHRASSARTDRDRAREAYDLSAKGLADLERGLEELVRRAGEHRLVMDRLQDLRAALAPRQIDPAALDELRAELGRDIESEAVLLATNERELDVAGIHTKEFERVLTLVRRMSDVDVSPGAGYAAGAAVLRGLRADEELANGRAGLEDERKSVARDAVAQAKVRAQASVLGLSRGEVGWIETVQEAWKASTAAIDEQERLERECQASAEGHESRASAQAVRIIELERDLAHWTDLHRRAATLESAWKLPADSGAALRALRSHLDATRLTHERTRRDAEQRRTAIRAEILALERAGGSPDERLLKVRDAVGGELVSDHLDDITFEEAAAREAVLGPLVHAVIVEDAVTAAGRLRDVDRPDTVWLVDKPAQLRPEVETDAGESVVAFHAAGLRLTKLPLSPILGRVARERALTVLHEDDARIGDAISAESAELHAIGDALDEVYALFEDAALLERTNFEEALALARAAATKADLDARHERSRATAAADELGRLRPYRTALQDILPFSRLLDEPDLGERLASIDEKFAQVEAAEVRLRSAGTRREALRDGLEILRKVPFTAAELEALRRSIDARRSRSETLLRRRSDVGYVIEHRTALTWTDAAAALGAKQGLLTSLKEQLEGASERASAAEDEVKARDTLLDESRLATNSAHGKLTGIESSLERERLELAETGVGDASTAALENANTEAKRCEDELEIVRKAHITLVGAASGAKVLHDQAIKDAETKREIAEREDQTWVPQQERWEQLQTTATEEGLLAAVLTEKYLARFSEGSIHGWAQARATAKGLLVELRRSADGHTLADEIEAAAGAEEQAGDRFLAFWRSVRTWVRRRVPPQIAEEPDPLAALGRLREHLRGLHTRLSAQEEDLRGNSQNVAHNIDIHVRKAKKQIAQLSTRLAGVGFGSIRSVRIDVRSVDRMTAVLDALRSGNAQQDLFDSSIPIEAALDALFARHAGGKTGGQKLLDYREYLDLRVEVMRRAGTTWEPATSTKLSTGEAIGVGASLMMVILAAWELDANLLRGKRGFGTLRLLFLDEANRLSPESLSVLFELCRTLELQLVVAAPEIAQAAGNTTYRLVRQIDADGREVVVAAGRRPRVVT